MALTAVALTAVALALAAPAGAAELVLERTLAPAEQAPASPPGEDQLPHSTRASGAGRVAEAWLTGATSRYAHGVLGDGLEASGLAVRLADGAQVQLALPRSRVFEDLVPRLHDLDGDGVDEITLVESDAAEGASLAVYGLSDGQLTLRARSPFIGRANRWLNPLGFGDFDGDGRVDIALVRTPHLGGVVELYRYAEPALEPMASRRGYSTHVIGSTELGLGRVAWRDGGRDRLLVPNQQRTELVLLELRNGQIEEVASVGLPATLSSSLARVAPNSFAMQLDNGLHYMATYGD